MLQTLWLQHLSKFVGYRSIGHICKLFNYSHLRCCFRVSKFHRFAVSMFQSFTASLFQCFKVSLLRCFRVSSHLRCCFKVPGFTALRLFQCFITPPTSLITPSLSRGGARRAEGSVNPKANQDLSVCFWESGGTSCFQ